MIGLLSLSGCWLFAPREVVSEPELVSVPPVLDVVPAVSPCAASELDALVRTSGAIAAPLAEQASVVRPVCDGAFGYAPVTFGEGAEGGAVAMFAKREERWVLLGLGTGVDCSAPPPPMTTSVCEALTARWQ